MFEIPTDVPKPVEVDHLLSRDQKFDAAFALSSDLEEATLHAKKLLCDGSMLKGYTVTERDVLKTTLCEKLIEIQRAVFQIADNADIDAALLAHYVLAGRS